MTDTDSKKLTTKLKLLFTNYDNVLKCIEMFYCISPNNRHRLRELIKFDNYRFVNKYNYIIKLHYRRTVNKTNEAENSH